MSKCWSTDYVRSEPSEEEEEKEKVCVVYVCVCKVPNIVAN